MKFTLALIIASLLSGCGSSTTKNDISILEVTTNDELQNLMKDVADFEGLNPIRVGYCKLGSESDGEKTYGQFFGKNPANQSFICLDTVLKDSQYTYKNRAYLISHEMCHYRQWLNGWHQLELDKPHDLRSYEIECINDSNNYWYAKDF